MLLQMFLNIPSSMAPQGMQGDIHVLGGLWVEH